MKKTLLFALSLLSLPMSSQTEVTEYRAGLTPEGITYFLPQTRLHLTLTATCTTVTPGEYAPYAQLFLRTDVPQKPCQEWQLNTLTVQRYGVADPTQAYSIKLKPKTSAPLVTLTADGCLLSVNATVEQPGELSVPGERVLEEAVGNPQDSKTPEILAAGSPLKAAEIAAGEIYNVRESRLTISKGEADYMPADGAQMQLMMDNLNKQEAGLLSLFKGTTTKKEKTFTLDVTPTENSEKVLFRFSKDEGLLPADATKGVAYSLVVTNETAAKDSVSEGAKKSTNDLRYRVPGVARVVIKDGNGQILYNATIPVAQFGRVERLGGDVFNKKMATQVFFDATTGGVKEIKY